MTLPVWKARSGDGRGILVAVRLGTEENDSEQDCPFERAEHDAARTSQARRRRSSHVSPRSNSTQR